MIKKSLVAIALTAIFTATAQAPTDIRVALIIGNSAYAGNLALTNPANDAAAMATALKNLGFTVVEARDASRVQMEDAVKKLFTALKGRQGVGMLYYAGHGLQVDWKNYMVPVDAKLQSVKDVPNQTLDVGDVLDAMKAAGSRMNIVILDACRDNPFADKGAKGLAPVDAPTGTLLAYATAPGNVAEDGTGSNGLYTKHLLSELQKPVSIESVFKRVRLNVRKESNGRQIPWESTSLEEDFYFQRGAAPQKQEASAVAAKRDADFIEQKAAWDKIKESTNANDFFAFLTQYPNGLLAEIASSKLEKLAASGVKLQPNQGEKEQAEVTDRLKIGDQWTVNFHSKMEGFFGHENRDTHTYQVTKSLGGDLLEVKRGAFATFYYTTAGAIGGVDQPLVPKVIYDPPMPQIPMVPFQVGYKSSSRSANIRSGSQVGVFDAHLHVVAREKLTIAMGTFDAYRIEVRTRAFGALGGASDIIWTRWHEANSAIPLKEVLDVPEKRHKITIETTSIKRAS
jgi:hypothetical protein